ncbi:MAG: SDR family oxidoreductase [Alcanivoracaceae bacterium]
MSADAMKGKVVVITGANSGIGKVAATALAGMGARVIMACRRRQAAEAAMQDIRREYPQADLAFVPLDLASLDAVRECARQLRDMCPRLDVLVNNAGIANMTRETTVDGFEKTFATNHLGPFLLTVALVPSLKAARGRVINVASDAHRIGRMHWQDLQLHRGYWVLKAYAQSKLCNILFTRALAKRVAGDNIKVNCLHPGAVSTSIWPEKHWWERAFSRVLRLFLISAEEGARTTIYLASGETGGKATGKYFCRCQEKQPAKHALDDKAAEQLWRLSEELTGAHL